MERVYTVFMVYFYMFENEKKSFSIWLITLIRYNVMISLFKSI